MKARLLSTLACAAAFAIGALSATANMPPPIDFHLGITVSPSPEGPRVTGFQNGSPAQRAGVRVGDLILGADGRYTKAMTAEELKAYVEGPHWGATLVVVHDGKTIESLQLRR